MFKLKLFRDAQIEGAVAGAGDTAVEDKPYIWDNPEADGTLAAPEEPATPEQPAEELKNEQPEKPAGEKHAEPETPAASEEKPTPEPVDWRKAVKGTDKYEVMKELGLDDFTIGMLKYKDASGDFAPYLKAKLVDYSKMSEAELIKAGIEKENPSLSARAVQILLDKKMAEYNLDRDQYPEDSDEAILGQELLKVETDKIRKELIKEQDSFTAPSRNGMSEAELEAQEKQLTATLLNNPIVANLKTNNVIEFGTGEEAFKYKVDNTDDVLGQVIGTLLEKGDDPKDFDIGQFVQSVAAAANWKKFLKEYGDHCRTLEKLSLHSTMQGIEKPESGANTPEPELSPEQDLARNGRYVQ